MISRWWEKNISRSKHVIIFLLFYKYEYYSADVRILLDISWWTFAYTIQEVHVDVCGACDVYMSI